MSKINLLDSSVFNLIAAGEVVENPSSVVKELAENSIDANAKSLKIEIENGGIRKIKITDNGSGIDREFVKTAFMPHATSKIAVANDLESITTLGFRGEALASIAAVSLINVRTRTDGSDTGYELNIKGGVYLDEGECVCAKGTVLTVENLFFNTPARIKFLKKPKTEEGYVTEAVIRLIFSNPYISFEYSVDGKTLFKTRGEGLEEAVNAVYNNEISGNLFKMENTSGQFRLAGLISKPTYTRPNRGYQTLMVNGRWVDNKTVASAIEKAYADYTLKRMYPMYVLNLTVPYDFVDVNVHPSKTDVRFQDNGAVFGFVFKSVYKYVSAFSEVAAGAETEAVEFIGEETSAFTKVERKLTAKDNISTIEDNIDENLINQSSASYKQSIDANKSIDLAAIVSRTDRASSALRSSSGISYDIMRKLAADEMEKKLENTNLEGIFGKDFLVIGQLFNTYIIVEKGSEVFFIDQHAAHEKLLYEQLLNKTIERAQQPMLIPYIVNISHHEQASFNDYLPWLNELGFDIEPFGSLSYKVSSVPHILAGINLKDFFDEVLSDLSGNKQLKSEDLLKERLAQTACKAAVKAGDKLTEMQIEQLLNQMEQSKKFPTQCPHGRPAVIRYSRLDIDKWFKRIV